MVEALPGGLLERLMRPDCPAAPGGSSWARARLRRNFDLLVLPDGTPLAPPDRALPQPRPGGGEPDEPLGWLADTVLSLWELRAKLPPRSWPGPASAAGVWRLAGERWCSALERCGSGPPWVRPHLDLLLGDLAARAGRPGDAQELLVQARHGFAVAGDIRGAAAAATVAGDWSAAGHSSPAAWGFALVPGDSADSRLPWPLERLERLPPAGPESALACYDAAERLYAEAGDSRGRAILVQRRAYLDSIAGRDREAQRGASEASRRLREAGDAPAGRLAALQAGLAGLAAGDRPEPAELAGLAAPGQPAGRSRGPAHAIGLGLLLGRAGRHWLVRECRPEPALVAFRAAEQVWARLGRRTAQSQSLADQAVALAGSGDVPGAYRQARLALQLSQGGGRRSGNGSPRHQQRLAVLALRMLELADGADGADGLDDAVRLLRSVLDPPRIPIFPAPDQQCHGRTLDAGRISPG